MIIRRETLKAVLPATVSGDTKYLLHGVLIEPDGRVVATDGYILLIATDKAPQKDEDFPVHGVAEFKGNPEKPVLLGRTAAEKLIAAMPKKGRVSILTTMQLGTNGDEGSVISSTDLQVPCAVKLPADSQKTQFPDYKRILPRADRPAIKVTLSVAVLQALIKSATAIQGTRRSTTGGTITFALPTEPQHQGMKLAGHEYLASPDQCDGVECPCATCGKRRDRHTEPDGQIIGAIAVSMKGGVDVDVEGVVMPCR